MRAIRSSVHRFWGRPDRSSESTAVVERFLGSVRRECLDHVLILTEAHLRRVLRASVTYFNTARPHQGIAQQVPLPSMPGQESGSATDEIVALPVLGGLHHRYGRAA
jgi:hypothetical protein